MANQLTAGTPSGEYNVIDNGAAPAFPTLDITKEHIGYDTTTGATSQMTNPFTNGTVPDPALYTSSGAVIGIVQKTNNVSTGSVASLAKAFASNNTAGNTIIVTCGVGNGTAPTVADTAGNTYAQVALGANSTTFEVAIFVASNIKAGANTVTVTNAGAAASIAMEIYELSNLVASNTAVVDSTGTNTAAAQAGSPAVTVGQTVGSEFSVVAFGLGTAAQTITVSGSYTNDSGQQNPVTPAGLFSFTSASLVLSGTASSSPAATAGVAEPWAVAAATFKPVSTSKQTLVLNSPLSTRVFFKNPA